MEKTDSSTSARIQLHLVLPYNHEPRRHPRIREQLDRGYRIVQLQRLSDQEVLITLDGDGSENQGS